MALKKTNIDWPDLDYVFDPLIGCKNNCFGGKCWAKKMNDRWKWIPDFTKPVFKREKLEIPYKINEPSTFFVVSKGDLFGKWIHSDIIRSVLKACADNPQHQFMFLTKNPKRYQYYQFTSNCWLGATMTGAESWQTQCDILNALQDADIENDCITKLFFSIEPLLGCLYNEIPSTFDLVIVGAMDDGSIKPKKEWIESIKHHNIHYKKNIKKYIT